MISRLCFLLLCGIITAHLGNAQKLPKVKKLNMRVHVNATGDTLVMKFLHKNENVKLEGFILGYGSNFFSNQYIQWPENGKSYVTEVDAEPRYLIAVKPNENQKKPCKEKNSVQKPLQLVVGTLTPTSVFLSWGILINPQFDWSVLNKCPNNRFYTVRYREKNKDWLYQLCPTTEIVIDNLKPNTMYEFGVKDNSEDGMWSKCQNHKTISKGKENGQSQNTYNIPKGFIQMAPEDTKVNIPITVIKQGFQNISHLISPKSTSTPHVTEKSPVYKEEPKKFPVTTTKSPVTKPKPVSKGTKPPSTAKTFKIPDTEDPKPVTSQSIVESFTPDSSAVTLEWVRGTMVTLPYIPVPSISTESSAIHDQSQAPPLVLTEAKDVPAESTEIPVMGIYPTLDPERETMAHHVTSKHLSSGILIMHQQSSTKALSTVSPVLLTNEPSFEQPDTLLASERLLATLTSQPMTIPQSTSAEIYPGSTDVPPMTIHDQQMITIGPPLVPPTSSSSLVVSVKRPFPVAHASSTQEIYPVSTDVPQMSTHVQQRTTLGFLLAPPTSSSSPDVTVKATSIPVTQKSSTQAMRKKKIYTEDKIQATEKIVQATEKIVQATEKIETADGLPLGPPKSTSIPGITMKKTSLPVGQAFCTQAGISTVSTDASQLSPHITLDKQKTTSGLALVPPTPSSAPDITVKRISLPGEQTSSTQATTMQTIQDKYSTLQSQTFTKPTTVTKETISLHSKPIHSTEAPPMEVDNTPVSEIITQEEPHTSEQHKIPIVSSEEQIVQNFATTSIPETETTTVLKGTQPLFLVEEARTTLVPNETQKISPSAPKTTFATESSFPKLDPKTTRHVPINLIRFHISEDPKLPLVPDIREKNVTSKPRKTTESPPSIPVTMTAKQMPINVIRLHVFDDQAVTSVPDATEKIISPKPRKATESPSSTAVPTTAKRIPINFDRFHIFDKPTITRAPSETHTTSRPTPKTSQSNKTSRSKPAPKPTQRVPINVISLQIFEEPEVSLVPNTTHTPPQPKPTQRTKRPITKPVPIETQKASTHKTKKPLPTPRPRAKLASTGSPKEFINPKIPPQTPEATLAPYKLQLSSSRPRTSLRPRTRPAQNGTTQGSIRARPTGDVNWITGTIPGGRAYDSTKLLGVSRNISMEPNNTSRRTFSVSSPPLLPVRPTSLHRRLLPTNVTGRPGSTGSVLLPRAPSTARPNRTTVSVKMPKKQPTTPTPEEDTEETTVFSPGPKSEIDALGKTRYTAPHVKYMRKEDTKPCSITDSLLHFPTEEASNQEILNAPQNPPSNLTVVTVEGCPSFVILDWEQPDNDTVTEYEVISKENGGPAGERESIIITNQTHSTVENLRPDTSYEFKVKPKNPLGEGPISTTVEFNTESADPKVSEPVAVHSILDSKLKDAGKDAIWTQIKFKSDSYSECKGKQFVKRTWYKKFVGIQLCNSLRYKIYLSDSLSGTFYNIGDQSGYGEDHCQFVDSFLDGRTGQQLLPEQLTTRKGFYRAVRQQPVEFGDIGGQTQIKYVHWYECGISIPGKW